MVRVGVGHGRQIAAGAFHHLIGDIDAVDLFEMSAHGPQKPPGPASDFERTAFARHTLEFRFQSADHIGTGCEELFVVLFAAAEGYVVVGVFASALIPFGTHRLDHIAHDIVSRLAIMHSRMV